MADLTFTIKTPAELAGAEKAATALGVAVGQAKALGTEFTVLENRLAAVNTSIAAFKSTQGKSFQTDDADRYAKALEGMAARDHDAKVAAWEDREKLAQQALGDLPKFVNTEATIQEAAKKTFTSKKQLKDMVIQLGQEFPMLGQLGRLALNPIVLATAAVTSAFVLFQGRVKELTRTLGGVELPEVKEDAIGRIDRMADAWGKLATKMAEASPKISAMRIDLEATVKLIQFNDAIQKALGISKPGQAADQEAAAKRTAADVLESEGRAKVAAADRLGSADNEAEAVKNAKSILEKATADKKEAEANLAQLQAFSAGEMGFFARKAFGVTYAKRYGADAPMSEAEKMERTNISTQGGVIARAERSIYAAAGRNAIRAGRSTGQKEIDDAAALRGEAGGLSRGAMTDRVASGHDKLLNAAESLQSAASSGSFAQVALILGDFAKTMGTLNGELRDVRAEAARIQRDAESRRANVMNP